MAFTGLIQPGERPAVLLHVGNESWFRGALLHRMTLAMSMARSREYGLPLVRATTHGASGFYEPRGGGWTEAGGDASHPALLRPRRTRTPFGRLSMLGKTGASQARRASGPSVHLPGLHEP